MAKNTLPVNYKDDILNSTMDGKRRYRMITNSDGTVSFEDVTTYDQVGSNFGAAQLNAANTAVNASADSNKIIDDLSTIAANTQEGYMAGALAVKELNQSLGKVLVTSGVYELNHTYGCGYYKNGNVVTVTVSFGNKTIPQSGITIGTLPASYRPSINVYARNSFDNQNGELFISSNGMVNLSSSKGTFDYGHFSISFAASSNFT